MSLLNRFPVRVLIYEKRGDNVILFKDKGRRVHKKSGEIYYELKRKKKKTPPISYAHIYPIHTGKHYVDYVFLYSSTPYTFQPIALHKEHANRLLNGQMTIDEIIEMMPEAIKEDKEKLKVDIKVSDKWIYWAAQQLKTNAYRAQYKTTLEKILPIAMVAITGMIIGIMFYMTIGQMEVISNSFASASNSMVQVAQQMNEVAHAMAGTKMPTSPPF